MGLGTKILEIHKKNEREEIKVLKSKYRFPQKIVVTDRDSPTKSQESESASLSSRCDY